MKCIDMALGPVDNYSQKLLFCKKSLLTFFDGVLTCPNSNCISRSESVASGFRVQ
ncbi:hypothetical protein CE195_09405, partial [Sodalis-like symbiont of Philaenus spumarius]